MSLSKPVDSIEYIPSMPGDDRLTTFPIVRSDLWKWYKDALACHWVAEEIDMHRDKADFEKLSAGEKNFLKHVLAFFAASDGIVNLNLAERFKREINILEANYFYDFQMAMENVHAEVYSLLLDTLIENLDERKKLLNAIETMPIIKKMTLWMQKCIKSTEPLPLRLLRMACVEGILFTWCFCAIYWLTSGSNGKPPSMFGLGQSNELIGRDEALHTMWALYLLQLIDRKYWAAEAPGIIAEAVDLASEFAACCLPHPLPMMNLDGAVAYIKTQANNMSTLLTIGLIYPGVVNKFTFMEQQMLVNRTNFFERRTTEYSKKQETEPGDYEILEDF